MCIILHLKKIHLLHFDSSSLQQNFGTVLINSNTKSVNAKQL